MGGDVLNMSLDEIIKTQKAQKSKKPKVLAGKWAMTKQKGNFRGRVSRKPQNNVRGGGRKNYQGGQQQGVSPIKRQSFPVRTRTPRMGRNNWKQGRANRQSTIAQPRSNSRYFNKPLPPLMETYRQRRNSSNRFGSKQQKLDLAIKSVRRAQLRLRKLKQTASTSRNFAFGRPRKIISSRIRVGKFGFVTTRRDNVQERRSIMQNKIIRAQMARNGKRTPATPSLPGPSRGRSRSRYGRQEPTPNRRNDWSPRGRSNRVYREREEFRSNYSRPPPRPRWEEDAWSPQPRRVQNDLYDPYSNAHMERPSSSRGLNPELQRKISRIQEQGRMSRGDEKYEPINETTDQFRIVSSSAMSLSDRFKTFMK